MLVLGVGLGLVFWVHLGLGLGLGVGLGLGFGLCAVPESIPGIQVRKDAQAPGPEFKENLKLTLTLL